MGAGSAGATLARGGLGASSTQGTSINGETGEVFAIQERVWYAPDFQLPASADAAVNAAPAIGVDAVNSALRVAAFDDTTEEGVIMRLRLLPTSTDMIFTVWTRAAVTITPGDYRVGLQLYVRRLNDGSTVGTWVDDLVAEITYSDNDWKKTTFNVTYSDFGVAFGAGDDVQLELTRVAPSSGTNLTGDLNLESVSIGFAG